MRPLISSPVNLPSPSASTMIPSPPIKTKTAAMVPPSMVHQMSLPLEEEDLEEEDEALFDEF